jgi:glycosyltransferase involved in cell wall biosynthesis
MLCSHGGPPLELKAPPSGSGTEMTKLSIGLPVYNRARLLKQSLDALLNQTFTEFELIISDNASTDGTEQICREYARRDGRIRYYRNRVNIGAPRNFNRTFELSSSQYFKWATSDDLCAPEFLELALGVLERDPAVVLCYAKSTIISADGSPIEEYDDKLHLMEAKASQRFMRLLSSIELCHQHQGVIRSAALRRTALLKDHIASDVNLVAELSLYGKFYELPQRLFFRRLHPDALSWEGSDLVRQMRFYDPDSTHRIVLHCFRAHITYLDAIRRAPIGFGEKALLYRFILRQLIWDRGRVAQELRLKARSLASGVTRRRPTDGVARRPE